MISFLNILTIHKIEAIDALKSFQNMRESIEKHLNGDFLVYEYLNQNQLEGNNVDEYSKLLNSLQLTKNQKLKKYQTLRGNYSEMNYENVSENLKSSKVESWNGKKDRFYHQYQQIQQKISTEFEVKNNLWIEIIEIKKSLNLLKGDIGHIIGRNEGVKLLQSKISKVKIVADDQLKKVQLAFTKDKEEFKTRVQMQKKFTKKLKNVSLFQDSTVGKLKKTYINIVLKKKEIYDRLNYIQKVSSSFNKTGEKEKLKNQKNNKIWELYSCLTKLTNLISKAPQAEYKYLRSQRIFQSSGMHEFVQWLQENSYDKREDFISQRSHSKSRRNQMNVNSNEIQMVTEENLRSYQKLVIVQYQRIKEKIQKQMHFYDMHMQKGVQLMSKLDTLQHQIQILQTDIRKQISLKYSITSQMRHEYNKKLKDLSFYLKTIFVLLEYVQKNVHYLHQSTKKVRKTAKSNSQLFVKKQTLLESNRPLYQTFNLKFTSPSELKKACEQEPEVWMSKDYISQLYKVYHMLMKENEDETSLYSFRNDVFDYLQSDIGTWFQSIKESSLKGRRVQLLIPRKQESEQVTLKFRKSTSKLRESRLSVLILPKTMRQIEEEEKNQMIEEDQFVRSFYMQHQPQFSPHRSTTSSKTWIQNRNQSSNTSFNKILEYCSPQSQIDKSKKLKYATEHHQQQAQRVKLLKNIDRDHYKMLKSTLKMEKQNTRKNYLFSRSFKRAKFSPHNQILEQKRFQCSFSMLFAGKKNSIAKQTLLNDSKQSSFFKSGNFQKRISKLNLSNQSLYHTQSSKISQPKSFFFKHEIIKLKQNGKQMIKSTNDQKSIDLKRKFNTSFKNIINLV